MSANLNGLEIGVKLVSVITFRYILMPFLTYSYQNFWVTTFLSLHLEINPCSSSPCDNGGNCVNTLDGSYTCFCETQWTGSNCESGNCLLVIVRVSR